MPMVEPAGPDDPQAARRGTFGGRTSRFCVIRNPFEKAISGFYFGKRRRRKSQRRAVDRPGPTAVRELAGALTGPMDRNTFCIKGQFALDEVIRHEILAADMQRICERLGLPWDPERLPALQGRHPPTGGHGEATVHAALAPVGARGIPLRAAVPRATSSPKKKAAPASSHPRALSAGQRA